MVIIFFSLGRISFLGLFFLLYKIQVSVTPQGYGDTELAKVPKSKLEDAVNKKNTK